MFTKLIFRNVKRNLQTYTIYFLTLSIIYCLLYGFNSLMTHPVMTDTSGIRQTMATIMTQYMGLISFVVVISAAFLMIYATNFVLKRRRRELGLYASLGMRNSKISLIIFCETVLVNFISLIIGFLSGIIFSCLLVKMATKIFATNYSGSILQISKKAIFILLISYIISSMLIGAMNFLKFKGKRVIALIQEEDSPNEAMNNSKINIVLFILSAIILVWVLIYTSINQDANNLLKVLKTWGYVIIPLLVLNIFFFYYSASQIVLAAIAKFQGFYFHKYNSFKFRQLAKQTDTNSMTLAVLSFCLMLALSVVIVGGSGYSAIKDKINEATPFDVTIFHNLGANSKYPNNNIESMLKSNGFDANQIKETYQFTVYESQITYKDILDTSKLWSLDKKLPGVSIPIVGLSDYNHLMKLQGKHEITLSSNEFAINANYDGTLKQIQAFAKKDANIRLAGQSLKFNHTEIMHNNYFLSSVGNNDRGTFIVPDKIAKQLTEDTSYFIAKYKSDTKPATVTEFLENWVTKYTRNGGLVYEYEFETSDRMIGMYLGLMGVIIFIMGFIGIIFSVIALSILSIQSSTQALDAVKDYEILYLLGSSRKSLKSLLRQQVFFYFLVPCLVALPFSYAVGKIILIYMSDFMHLDIGINYNYTLTVFVTFVLYLLLTDFVCQKIIKNA